MLKQYVETDSVEMTATSGRRASQGGLGRKPGGNWDRGPWQIPGGSSQWDR